MTYQDAALKAAMTELLDELAHVRELQGPLSVRPGGDAHDVIDGRGQVVATISADAINDRARKIARARN